MKLAVVVGGWHWPSLFFIRCSQLAWGADLFCVSHRSPDLPIVAQEKSWLCAEHNSALLKIDRDMYEDEPLSVRQLSRLGWKYQEAENCSGDWTFFNQWLDTHDYRKYDVILNCHDDTYFRPGVNVFEHVERNFFGSWDFPYPRPKPLMIANGRFPNAPLGYVRGSFEFWTRELLDMLGGRIPIPELSLNREGLTDTPKDFVTLMAWNAIGDPLRKFFCDEKLTDRVHYLSEFYRVSEYLIEGERGLISSNIGAPWSYTAGLERYPLK